MHECDDLLVIDKPCGLASQSGVNIKTSLDQQAQSYMEFKYGPDAKAFLVHRLDQATSGLMLIAKSKDEARRVTGMF